MMVEMRKIELSPSNTCASTRLKAGLGVGRTISRTCNWRPACSQTSELSPTLGIWLDRRALTSSFSAHSWASMMSACRHALRVSAVGACRPAMGEDAQAAPGVGGVADLHLLRANQRLGAQLQHRLPVHHGAGVEPLAGQRGLRAGA